MYVCIYIYICVCMYVCILWHEMMCFFFRGGLSNKLYICSLPESYGVGKEERRKVVLRIYGPLYDELVTSIGCLIADSVVFALLSEWNIGPKLFAIFPEGRLEELLMVSVKIDSLSIEQEIYVVGQF